MELKFGKMLNTVLRCIIDRAGKYGGGSLWKTVRAVLLPGLGCLLLCGGLSAQEPPRLFYRISSPAAGGKAGGGIGSNSFANGQVFCKYEHGYTVDVWLEAAAEDCRWTVGPTGKVSVTNPRGPYNDTVTIDISNTSNTEITNVTISVIEGSNAPVLMSVVIPRIAAAPGAIIIDPLELLDGESYCANLSYTVDVPEDPNYTKEKNNYDPNGTYPSATLKYNFSLGTTESAVPPLSSRGYSDDPASMYHWEQIVGPAAKYWVVRAKTCEAGNSEAVKPASLAIDNVIPENLTDESLSVIPIRYAGEEWEESDENACTWYSSAFNKSETGAGNAVGGLNDGETENGYVYLQAMPYQPDDISFRHYRYIWNYDEDALEPATDKMNTATYKEAGFGADSARICFKVKSRPEGTDPVIRVSYHMVCDKCNERAQKQGRSIVFESAESAVLKLNRVDSLEDAVVKGSYTPSILDKGERVESIDGSPLLLCGNTEYDLCGEVDGESPITGFMWKALNGADWEQSVGGGDMGGGMWPAAPRARQSLCDTYVTPEIAQTDTHMGDTVNLLVYPRNQCFSNGRTTDRNAQEVKVYVRSTPQAPIVIDPVSGQSYKGNNLEAMGGGSPTIPMGGLSFPLLLCNNSGLGSSSAGASQSLLLYTPNNTLRASDESFEIKFYEDISNPSVIQALRASYSFERNNPDKELGDTTRWTFRFKIQDHEVLADQKQIVVGIAAKNTCGPGTMAFWAINIIDTLSVEGDVIDNGLITSGDTVVHSLCEGEERIYSNISSAEPLFVTDAADPDRNTDVVQYSWKIPGTWRFDNPRLDSVSVPDTRVWLGEEKGAVRLALKNRCGVGTYRRGDSLDVNAYTRVDIKVVDGLLATSAALNPKVTADKAEIDRNGFLLLPCQGSQMMYAIDTFERTDAYRWEFPSDWQVVTDVPNQYNGEATADPDYPNRAITDHRKLGFRNDMRVRVKVGADTGQIYVVGAKAACAWTFDNFQPNLTVVPPHFGHRRDSLKAVVRPFTGKPAQAEPWPDSICVRKVAVLSVMPDPEQDSLTRAQTYFTWTFPSDYLPVHYADENHTELTFTVPDRAGDYDTVKVYSHRHDCDSYNQADSMVVVIKLTDTIPFVRTRYLNDARRPNSNLNTTPCEGDTVIYRVLPDPKTYLEGVWFTWNGGNALMDTATGLVDATGWRILNPVGQYADTLKMIVGRSTLELGAQAVSPCGMSSVFTTVFNPVGLVHDKVRLVQGSDLLCMNERVVFEWDSVEYATHYEWFYPWGQAHDTLGLDEKMFYRAFSSKTAFEKGLICVRPYNVCGLGPYSDTVKVSDVIQHLGLPSLKALDPETVYVPVNDTVRDTVCLRTGLHYQASFNDDTYADNSQWKFHWIPFQIDENDTLKAVSPDVFADSSRFYFANYGMENASKYFGVAVRHARCLTPGDTLVMWVRNADTVAISDDVLADRLTDEEREDKTVMTRPCGGSTATAEWHFNSDFGTEKIQYRFVWWDSLSQTRSRYHDADGSMVGGAAKKEDNFIWLNPKEESDPDKAWYSGDEDYLRVSIPNNQLLYLSVDLKNRCGISRLPSLAIRTVVSIGDSSYKLQQLSDLVCDGDSLVFRVDSSANIGGYIWHYPWQKTLDTVKVGTQVVRVFNTKEYKEGEVYVVPYNGCGNAKESNRIEIKDILPIPARAVPVDFDPAYDAEKDPVAKDTLCMRTPLVLHVSSDSWKEDGDYEMQWRLVKGSALGFERDGNSCTLRQNDVNAEPFELEFASRTKGCRRYSDTLQIRILSMDTLTFAIVEDEEAGLGRLEVLLPQVVRNYSDNTPIDRRPCGGTGQKYTIAGNIHWSIISDAESYFSWNARGEAPQTSPGADSSLGGTDWKYEGASLNGPYRDLPLRVGAKEELQLHVNVRNICGISQSPALSIVPKPAVTQAPAITPKPVCLDAKLELDCQKVDNAEIYHWQFPWGSKHVESEIPHVEIDRITDIDGLVTVYASNDCGPGPVAEFNAMVIHTPRAPQPAWKENGAAYVWDADTVTETICLHGESELRVTRNPSDAPGLSYRWGLGGTGRLEIISASNPDSVCRVRAASSAAEGDEEILKAVGYYKACGGAGDTLFIRLRFIDTIPVASLGGIKVLPAEYQTENNPCPEEELTLRVENDMASAYRWRLPATWRFKAGGDTVGAEVTVVVGNTRGAVSVAPWGDPSEMGCDIAYPNPLRTIEYIPRSVPQTPAFAVSFNGHPCVGSVVTYQLESSDALVVLNTPARWEFPADWKVQAASSELTEGANIWPVGNFSCSVLVGKDSGEVRAYQLDSCGNRLVRGTLRQKTVEPIDTARIQVRGDENACLDSTVFLTVEALNDYARADGYNLEVVYMGEDKTPLQITFPGRDSSYLEIVCRNRDSVRLVFTPKNGYCAQNALPFVHYLITDTVPNIPGIITGPERICADNRYEFVFHMDPDKVGMFDSVSYTWKVPHDGWRILSGLHDTAVTLYFDSLPSALPGQRTADTIACYPRAGCGTAFPTLFVVTLQPQDIFDDSIVVSKENPCLGTDIEVWLKNKDRYDTDTIRFVWNTPAGWQRLDNNTLPQTAYSVQYDTASYIQVRYLRNNGCGLSQTVQRRVNVKDSASKAVFDGIPYPCYTRNVYEVAIAPDPNIDSIAWMLAPSVVASVHTRQGSRIDNDSLSIDNAGHSTAAIAFGVRSFNECGSRDTVLTVTPVTSTTPFDDNLHAPLFCLSDTGYVYINLSAQQQKEGFYFRWNFPDSAYRVVNATVPGDTVAVMAYLSDTSLAGATLVLQSGNDCRALEDQQIDLTPFTYAISAVSEYARVHYGRDAVRIEVKETTAGELDAFTYRWIPENRLNPNGVPDTSWRLTGKLVQEEELFLVESRQRMRTGEENMAFYLRQGRCRAVDSIRIAVDSLFSLVAARDNAACMDMEQELAVEPRGGNTQAYHVRWWRFNGEDWEEIPGTADSLRITISESGEGDYMYRVTGWDSTFVYADTLYFSDTDFEFDTVPVLVTSHADTVLLYVSTYALDVRFGNVASDRIEIPVGSRVEIETRVYDGTGAYRYAWTPEDLIMRVDSSSGNMKTFAIFHADELRLVVTDTASGCVAERVIRVEMAKGSDIPNVITPNGDGKNDIFLKGVSELIIYTRWGEEIFHDLTGSGWDGTYKGKTVRPGEYMYVAGVTDENGTKHVFKGVVTVKY